MQTKKQMVSFSFSLHKNTNCSFINKYHTSFLSTFFIEYLLAPSFSIDSVTGQRNPFLLSLLLAVNKNA
ncbi:unnamed protein product [Ilex paraguariensis]|uniref:Uncharacterized protein n=1 Tax=Ilex paraguariensis TaxID=185542 RepID=A0ABC8STQ6_9AQUA